MLFGLKDSLKGKKDTFNLKDIGWWLVDIQWYDRKIKSEKPQQRFTIIKRKRSGENIFPAINILLSITYSIPGPSWEV